MSLWFILLCSLAVLAYAAVGGIFVAFSDFIMRSFDLVTGKGGIESMQVLNVEIMRSIFMVMFLGMIPVSLVIAVYAGVSVEGTASRLLIAAGALYLVGVFLLTGLGNVPLNNRLAAMDPAAAQTLSFWKDTYMTRWVNLNSIRAVVCMVSSGLTLAALVIR